MTPYDPILTKIGFFYDQTGDNKLSASYTDNVISLINNGNREGPPSLHFDSDEKLASLLKKTLYDSNVSFHQTFIKLFQNKVLQSFDVPGATPLAIPGAPVFDVSSATLLGLPILPLPPTGAEVPWALALAGLLGVVGIDPASTLAALVIRLNAGGVITPSFPITPQRPQYVLSSFKGLEFLNDREKVVPGFSLDRLLSDLIQLPFVVFSSLFVPSLEYVNNHSLIHTQINQALFSNVATSPSFVLLLQQRVVPTTLIASIVTWIKNVSAVMTTVMIGLIVGAGDVAKNVATLTGII